MSRRNRAPAARRSIFPWVLGGVGVAGLAIAVMVSRGPAPHVHPQPRENEDLAVGVMPAAFFPGDVRAQTTYRIAKQIPVVLDGIYCFCYCHETIGHRSLLQCFQSQHGAGCDVCMAQAELADRMNREGRTLNEIRAAMDATWGP